jgi:hypothetical protein
MLKASACETPCEASDVEALPDDDVALASDVLVPVASAVG